MSKSWIGIPFFLALSFLFYGCSGLPGSTTGSTSNQYGRYANDPSVDLKRRDVLPPAEPTPAEEMLSTFEVADGFKVELFAAEPMVTDPVAMTVDPQGRMYVVELHGYPDDEEGSSTIKQLTDTDGDGYPDEYTVFAEGLRMPKGVMSWKEGLLVTDAPNILYLEDTDEDGHADIRETLLTGFDSSNPQLGINTPVYGLDNWIYMAHRAGSQVTFPEHGDSTINVSRNVRYRPDEHQLEDLAAQSQFGQTFGAFGAHFSLSNSNHIYHEVLASPYVQRNSHLLVNTVTEVIPDHGASAQVYPITPDPKNRLGKPGGITSASGLVSYLGGAFPTRYKGATFVGEPIYNVVHVDKLSKAGATFRASRMQEGKEFLASTDRWFRPVNFYVGPDGALYVLDYSRRIIEQPRFLTKQILEAADLYTGSDRGRIYRITPQDMSDPSWMDNLQLSKAAPEELVQGLEHQNLWWRRSAQRLLVDRQPKAAVEPLVQLVRESELPEGRVHALWTLHGLNALKPALIDEALRDDSPGVRKNAVKLAELHLLGQEGASSRKTNRVSQVSLKASTAAAKLVPSLMAMADDEDPQVRFQLLLTLGYIKGKQAQDVRQKMLFADLESKWMQMAALSASDGDVIKLYKYAIDQLTGEATKERRSFFKRTASVIGARHQAEEVKKLISTATHAAKPATSWWQAATLEGLAEGLKGTSLAESAVLEAERQLLLDQFFTIEAAALRLATLEVLEAVGLPREGNAGPKAQAVVRDEKSSPERRAHAIRLLALTDLTAHLDLLKELIDPAKATPVQQEAVRAMGQLEAALVGPFLVSSWSKMTPSVREVAIRVLLQDLNDHKSIFRVFDAIEAGIIQPTAIPRHLDERLVEHNDKAVRRRANKVLRQEAGKRQEVVEAYESALEMESDTDQGQQVFQQACARCHQMGGEGGMAFGPDLRALENRPPKWLLKAILIPNHAIADGYEQWTIERKTGERIAGIIASETPTSITMRNAGGQETTIARTDVASIEELSGSAMPVGLEHQITKQEMAHLLSYLMSVQTVN